MLKKRYLRQPGNVQGIGITKAGPSFAVSILVLPGSSFPLRDCWHNVPLRIEHGGPIKAQ